MSESNLRMSVVIPSYGRGDSVARLVQQLGTQTLAPSHYEVVVVDDSGTGELADRFATITPAMSLQVINTTRFGAGGARAAGVRHTRNDILLFLDDDMQVGPEFLSAHLALHAQDPHAVVLGNIQPDAALTKMPLFERFHAHMLALFQDKAEAGTMALRGVHLCSGNVSMRQSDYKAVGGFAVDLPRSEDRELGIRLEKSGCRFFCGRETFSIHSSDHGDPRVWLERAFLYGQADSEIERRHPDVDNAHPWRFFYLVHPLSRLAIIFTLLSPRFGHLGAQVLYRLACAFDSRGYERLALRLTTLVFGLQYFRGVRVAFGGLRGTWREARRHARTIGQRPPQRGRLAECIHAILADYDSTRRYRAKYHAEQISRWRLLPDLVRKIGFQILVAYRLMRLARGLGIPFLPQLMSRAIRIVYGSDIHWDARLEPGISIVHGMGLAISHGAVVERGAILFHNVTLGESIDPVNGSVGAPHVGADVHIGPGATLLGPIDVGERSKIMAGAVLCASVPAQSLVESPRPTVSHRATSLATRMSAHVIEKDSERIASMPAKHAPATVIGATLDSARSL